MKVRVIGGINRKVQKNPQTLGEKVKIEDTHIKRERKTGRVGKRD